MRGIKFKCSFIGSKTNLNYDGTSTCVRKRKKYLLDRTELILLMVQVKQIHTHAVAKNILALFFYSWTD